MSHVYQNAAIRIMDWLHHAERDLIGWTVATFNGEAGVVKAVTLDDHHGLCFTLDNANDAFVEAELNLPRRRWYPISTIKEKARS